MPSRYCFGCSAIHGPDERCTRKRPSSRTVARLRRLIHDRDDGTCQNCGQPVPLGSEWDLHHRVEFAMGGNDDPSNLEVRCVPCNRSRA